MRGNAYNKQQFGQKMNSIFLKYHIFRTTYSLYLFFDSSYELLRKSLSDNNSIFIQFGIRMNYLHDGEREIWVYRLSFVFHWPVGSQASSRMSLLSLSLIHLFDGAV